MGDTRSAHRRRIVWACGVLAATALAEVAPAPGPMAPAPTWAAASALGTAAGEAAALRMRVTLGTPTHPAGGDGDVGGAGTGTEPAGRTVAAVRVWTATPRRSTPGADVVPAAVLSAYRRAETALRRQRPGCGLHWWMLAGIGKVESDHAGGGLLDATGTTPAPILGPALRPVSTPDARPALAPEAISASDLIEVRARGPMQFLPATWAAYGDGGNIDNMGDAALAAGRLLCSGGARLAVPDQWAAALHRYNDAPAYVAAVLGWARVYAASDPAPAPRPRPAPARLDRPRIPAPAAVQAAITFARAQLGRPYAWGGNGGIIGFDCSGLTTAAYAAAGITLPRTAQTQFDAGPELPASAALKPGDLLFYGTRDHVHHVGLYVGAGRMIDAPSPGRSVELTGYRAADYLGATRPAGSPPTASIPQKGARPATAAPARSGRVSAAPSRPRSGPVVPTAAPTPASPANTTQPSDTSATGSAPTGAAGQATATTVTVGDAPSYRIVATAATNGAQLPPAPRDPRTATAMNRAGGRLLVLGLADTQVGDLRVGQGVTVRSSAGVHRVTIRSRQMLTRAQAMALLAATPTGLIIAAAGPRPDEVYLAVAN